MARIFQKTPVWKGSTYHLLSLCPNLEEEKQALDEPVSSVHAEEIESESDICSWCREKFRGIPEPGQDRSDQVLFE